MARIRSGEYEGMAEKLSDPEWKPDFGPDVLNEKAGAMAVGAREFLIAYNIDLNTTDRRYANELAYVLRERGRWKRTGNTEPFYYKHHNAYRCRDSEQTRAFYEDFLGLTAGRYAGDQGDQERPRDQHLANLLPSR